MTPRTTRATHPTPKHNPKHAGPTCICGKPTDATLCHTCTRTARRWLRNLPTLADDLVVTKRRQDNVQAANVGGHGSDAPIPINLDAAAVLDRIYTVLAQWARPRTTTAVRLPRGVHGPLEAPAPRTVAGMTVRIIDALPRIRRQPAASELYGQLKDLTEDALKAVDHAANRVRITVGPCPQDVPDDDGTTSCCPGMVVAIVPDETTTPPRMECPACGTVWASIQWLRAGMRIVTRQRLLDQQRDLALSVLGGRLTA